LNDADRRPWLEAIREVIRAAIDRGENAVIACSALKESYRRMLQIREQVSFVYLKASIALIQDRLKNRTGHFMNPHLVQSQFDTLEAPEEALQIDAGSTPAEIVQVIRNRLAV
jgi:gluconokinase